jgi:MFS family permease
MRLMISFAALFMSVLLLQISTGGVGPLDALSGLQLGFSKTEIGALGSAHFIGFFIGCWWAPRLLGSVGHSRAFAAFTSVGAIGLLAHMLWVDPWVWSVMRVGTGLCVAGCYTIIESWLQAKLTNETRGRAMGGYRVIDLSGSIAAQLMIGVLEPASYVSYNLLAILCCAALLPIALTRSEQPATPSAPRLRPMLAMTMSPLAVAGVVVAGVSSGAFRMVGPVYGQEVGLRADQIAYFLAAFVLGGALAQVPVGWLADKIDRRWILIWLSVASTMACAVTVMTSDQGTVTVMLVAGLFGFTTFPIYSVAAAHAHDFASSDERVELSAALMFWFAVGAIAAPFTSSQLLEHYGPGSLFIMIAVAHLLLAIIGVVRMGARPAATERTPYIYMPRTSFIAGRLFKGARDRRKP